MFNAYKQVRVYLYKSLKCIYISRKVYTVYQKLIQIYSDYEPIVAEIKTCMYAGSAINVMNYKTYLNSFQAKQIKLQISPKCRKTITKSLDIGK